MKDHLLHVAMDTLAVDGIAGFTTRRVADRAGTSIPAVYELFGDKGGLIREVFFEGFRMLLTRFEEAADSGDARTDIERVIEVYRTFVRANPVLAQVMFSSPFSDFDPGPEEIAAGVAVREHIVGHVRRCIDAGVLAGDPTDIAHVLTAMAQGVATQESAGWLGRSRASMNRRWALAVRSVLDGLAPERRA